MISMRAETIKQRSENFAEKLKNKSNLSLKIIRGFSVIGGGSAPDTKLETFLLSVRHEKYSASQIEEILRNSKPPVIARILEDQLLIDLRTVSDIEENDLLRILAEL